MSRINPINFFRLVYRWQIKIHHDGFLVAPDYYTQKRFIRIGIDLLMGYKRRYVNKISWAGVGEELQLFPPTHPRSPAYDINDAFQFPMMMGRRFGIGVNVHRSGPEFICSGSSVVDCSCPGHARGLRSVEIELPCGNDLDSMIAPIALR